MAFDINLIGGFGTGALGSVADDVYAGNLNSYARVTAIDSTAITIDTSTAIHGAYEDFTAGTEIIFHVSAAAASTSIDYLGKWKVVKINSVVGNVLYVDGDVTTVLPVADFGKYYCQVVSIAQFENLTLNENVQIVPLVYSTSAYVGGITALKCSGTLTFSGGNINLAGRGIPTGSTTLRPLMTQEGNAVGYYNYAPYSAWENHITRDRLTLNSPDGTAFIAAKKIIGNADSRIGNPSQTGTQFNRAKSYSYLRGGSTIFIAADEIQNFAPAMIAKTYSAVGQGLARCFIATNTRMTNDEALYSCDVLSDPKRPMDNFNVRNFGDGSLGDGSELTMQLNNYATVTAISTDRKILTYNGKTTAGIAQITRGALVMIHYNHKSSTSGVDNSGKFIVAKVLADTGTEITIDTPAPNISLADCNVQIISIPQYNNFTLSKKNSATPAYKNSQGGIFAVAVKNNCNISGGVINLEGKGGGTAYGAAGVNFISNVNMNDRLPIGAGNGSAFILAKNLTMDGSTRIGGTYDGSKFAGTRQGKTSQVGHIGENNDSVTGGSPSSGGKGYKSTNKGGYGSNGGKATYAGGSQGAHILIIADTITGFNQAAISTGGMGGKYKTNGNSGGAGYGGGAGPGGADGGYNGGGGGGVQSGGGGGSGWAYVYCNNAVNQNTDKTLTD